MSSLREFVAGAVRSLSADVASNLVERLEALGIRTREDCFEVTERDLPPELLNPRQKFQFLAACSSQGLLLYFYYQVLRYLVAGV